VVVPIKPTLSWGDAKGFTRAVAEFMVATFPDRFTATVAKAKRKDRIFVDYLRNAEGATAVAPYSVRARKNAPVATPIFWEELAKDVRFDHFNVRNIRARLAKVATRGRIFPPPSNRSPKPPQSASAFGSSASLL
jgi:bifunctional non-homologous end joining protein LigD